VKSIYLSVMQRVLPVFRKQGGGCFVKRSLDGRPWRPANRGLAIYNQFRKAAGHPDEQIHGR